MSLIFLVVALVLFILAAIPVSSRISLGWVGMACFAASFLIGRV